MPVWSLAELVVVVDATLELLEVLAVFEDVDELPVEEPVPEALFAPDDPVPLVPELDPAAEDWELAPLDDALPDADPELLEALDAEPLLPPLPASPWVPPASPGLELLPVCEGPSPPPADTV